MNNTYWLISYLIHTVSLILYLDYSIDTISEITLLLRDCLSTSTPLSPSTSKERGKVNKEGLAPLLDTPGRGVIMSNGQQYF